MKSKKQPNETNPTLHRDREAGRTDHCHNIRIINKNLSANSEINKITIMREIKFRAWDGSRLRSWNDIVETIGFHHWIIKGCEGVEVMQYTGLKDKQGKEIYEGDILKLNYEAISMIGYVKQQSDGEWIFYKDKGNFLGVHHNMNKIRIIGNIYEDKHLLK